MADSHALCISLDGDLGVVMTRGFQAPREHVFDAFTQPDMLRRWYGPTGWTMTVCDIDLKPGGAFRFVSRRADGRDIGQFGIYREVSRPGRIVFTECWEQWNPGETLVTHEFADDDRGTLLTTTMRFPSKAVRDTILKSGLEHSCTDLYMKLDAFFTE